MKMQYDLRQEALALSRARRSKIAAGTRPAIQAAAVAAAEFEEPQEPLALDLHVETAALQRAHRALRASNTFASPKWTDEEGLGLSWPCPVCGTLLEKGEKVVSPSAGAELDGPAQAEEVLGARIEVLEELLSKTRPQAAEAAACQRRLRAAEAKTVDLEAALDLASRTCDELFSTLELQTAEFQAFAAQVRAAAGPWLEQQNQLEVQLGAVLKAITLPGEKPNKLREELQTERRRLQVSRRRSRRESAQKHEATIRALQTKLLEAEAPERTGLEQDLRQQLDRSSLKASELESALAQQQAKATEEATELKAQVAALEEGAEAKQREAHEAKVSRAKLRIQRTGEGKGLVARSLEVLSTGVVVYKLCAGNGKWQERFLAVTPAPPAAPESLKWSKDVSRRRLSSPSVVPLKEVVHVGFGSDALPEKHRQEVSWCCFSVWTAQRSFHFKAGDERIAENFVLGLSRLCPGTKPASVHSLILHRALGKLGPDGAARAAAISAAVRRAAEVRKEELQAAESAQAAKSEEEDEDEEGEESEHTSDEEKSATSAEPERIPIKNRAALCSYFDALDNVQQRDVVCAKMS
ncbi:unnamed protein product [Effrenium voratum]|uniref:PH domain-containing protein n=2 Tax=Effrenium voratum TaxID=2562239 RepID=A0AA36NB63_9DINO|nr:unnamed protein product [Effrenium voratum]CAJ1395918.1 unnamed protein product [Effrenium voratum]CAJ1440818.1 unnamed protein product [Effrenium voratum]